MSEGQKRFRINILTQNIRVCISVNFVNKIRPGKTQTVHTIEIGYILLTHACAWLLQCKLGAIQIN